MKKQYITLTTLIAALILILFGLVGFFSVYISAKEILKEYEEKATLDYQDLLKRNNYESESEFLRSVYYGWKFYSVFNEENIGFAGNVSTADNFIKTGDFIYVSKIVDGFVKDTRIIPVDSTFDCEGDNIWNIEFDGMCDDVYLHDGTLKYIDTYKTGIQSYSVGKSILKSESESVPFSEWSGDIECYVEVIRMAKTSREAALNKEAEELLDEIITKIDNGEKVEFQKSGLREAYMFFYDGPYIGDIKSDCYMFVFHPIRVAVMKHLALYILGTVLFIIIEVLVITIMYRLYKSRRDFEIQSQSLTRGIAHDLKTPLAVMKAYVENWEYIDEDERSEYSDKLSEEVDSMSDMVSRLLDKSKIDSGMRDPKLEEVELYSLTKSVYKKMQPIAEERGLRVIFETDKDESDAEDITYPVYADLEMMRIVVSNYISNAIKYSDSFVKIWFFDKGNKIKFLVSNDGDGIDKKDIKKVWNVFYKTDSSRTDRLGNNGLGLAICKSIFKLHKAKYGCSSRLSETNFWFEMKKVKDGK